MPEIPTTTYGWHPFRRKPKPKSHHVSFAELLLEEARKDSNWVKPPCPHCGKTP